MKFVSKFFKLLWQNLFHYLYIFSVLPVSGSRRIIINYDINDYSLSSQFYTELLQWWSEFHDNFASTKDWVNIVWYNKDIRINDGPVFYKSY